MLTHFDLESLCGILVEIRSSATTFHLFGEFGVSLITSLSLTDCCPRVQNYGNLPSRTC